MASIAYESLFEFFKLFWMRDVHSKLICNYFWNLLSIWRAYLTLKHSQKMTKRILRFTVVWETYNKMILLNSYFSCLLICVPNLFVEGKQRTIYHILYRKIDEWNPLWAAKWKNCVSKKMKVANQVLHHFLTLLFWIA